MEDKRINTMRKAKEPLSGDLLKANQEMDKELARLKGEYVKMKYTMEDWDKMYGLENDEKFIRAIFETVIGDNLANWTREELLRHLNDLLNERDEALTKCEELIEDNCTLSGIIRRMK